MANPDVVVIGTPVFNSQGKAVMVLSRELNEGGHDVVVFAVRREILNHSDLEAIKLANYKKVERKRKQWAYYLSDHDGALIAGIAKSIEKRVAGIELPENSQYSHPFGMQTQVDGQLTALVSYRMAVSEFEVHVYVNLAAKEAKSLVKKLTVAGYKSHGAENGWQKFVETVQIAEADGFNSVTDYVYHAVHMPLANSYKKAAKS